MATSTDKANDYLSSKHLYLLGDLTTERPHPLTKNLSEYSKSNLLEILSTIKDIEIKLALDIIKRLGSIQNLQAEIEDTLNNGGRIFICGCGATGRLALTLEYLWRAIAPKDLRDRVIGFMAGGDVALIRSLERIEDQPEMGSQHLMSLGFNKNDLLISCTEGGETPYVIGATEEAAWIAKRKPYFLFCNSADLLSKKVERSKNVIQNKNIVCLELAIDPMVLAGSTRLQATTALLLTVGAALFPKITNGTAEIYLNEYLSDIQYLKIEKLKRFIELESEIYLSGNYTLYQTESYGITILTDTTERSPTFSLTPFENNFEVNPDPSLCYLHLINTNSSYEAWHNLLLRTPRPEGRPDWIIAKGEEWIWGYDLSTIGKEKRFNRLQNKNSFVFNVWDEEAELHFELRGHHDCFKLQTEKLFLKHLLLKVLLNTHSTLLMGRLERYQKNIMTFVKPSCGKLVDRAIRNIQFVLQQDGIKEIPSYDDLAHKIFYAIPNLKSSEAIVVKVVDEIKVALHHQSKP